MRQNNPRDKPAGNNSFGPRLVALAFTPALALWLIPVGESSKGRGHRWYAYGPFCLWRFWVFCEGVLTTETRSSPRFFQDAILIRFSPRPQRLRVRTWRPEATDLLTE